jgi:4a-hydroxytetrahydrobiopterin dehydratase
MVELRVLSDEEIQQRLQQLPQWEYREGWLRRKYRTPGYAHTLLLANAIGYISEAAYHHPDLTLGYAELTVKLQTHKVRGITELDFELAKRIEQLATWKPEPGSPLPGFPKKWVE